MSLDRVSRRKQAITGPGSPWIQDNGFSNEEMLLSCSKDQGYQIGLRLIPASWEGFPGTLL